jgi:ubiquinone/menaquinone biosynthesis C-methylase UbiE
MDLLIRKLRHARRFDRRLIQGSALGLPFRDGAFEQVLCSNLLELLPRDGKALDELVRVLAPGGRLVVATPDYGRWLWVLTGALYERFVPGAGASRHRARYTKRALVADLAGRGCVLDAARSILGAEVVLAFRRAGRLECQRLGP